MATGTAKISQTDI